MRTKQRLRALTVGALVGLFLEPPRIQDDLKETLDDLILWQ